MYYNNGLAKLVVPMLLFSILCEKKHRIFGETKKHIQRMHFFALLILKIIVITFRKLNIALLLLTLLLLVLSLNFIKVLFLTKLFLVILLLVVLLISLVQMKGWAFAILEEHNSEYIDGVKISY